MKVSHIFKRNYQITSTTLLVYFAPVSLDSLIKLQNASRTPSETEEHFKENSMHCDIWFKLDTYTIGLSDCHSYSYDVQKGSATPYFGYLVCRWHT